MIAMRYYEEYGLLPMKENAYAELAKHGYLEPSYIEGQRFTTLQHKTHPSIVEETVQEDVPYIEAHIVLPDDDDDSPTVGDDGVPMDEVINVPPMDDDEDVDIPLIDWSAA